MSAHVTVTWLGHASFRIAGGGKVVYIDPWKLAAAPHDGDVALISHGHYDHLSPEDVAKALKAGGVAVGPADATARLGKGLLLAPGQQVEAAGVSVEGVAAYNVGKKFHPRQNNWLGLLVRVGGRKIYYSGDTDLIEEMAGVGEVDLALLPVGGTYTMTAAEAAEAAGRFKPRLVVPYHWGDIVGSRSDAEELAALLGPAKARVIAPGESLTL